MFLMSSAFAAALTQPVGFSASLMMRSVPMGRAGFSLFSAKPSLSLPPFNHDFCLLGNALGPYGMCGFTDIFPPLAAMRLVPWAGRFFSFPVSALAIAPSIRSRFPCL